MANTGKTRVVASLDIGTNSVLLLLAECDEYGGVKPINEYIATTRLGEGLSESGLLSAEAMSRTIRAAEEMRGIAIAEKAAHLIVTATSAVREAGNRSQFLVECHKRLKIYPQVLSGKEEARLSFLGGCHEIDPKTPAALIDIGGGSMEIAYGFRDQMINGHSLAFGCVNIAEKFGTIAKITMTRQMSVQNHIRRAMLPLRYEVGDWGMEKCPEVLVCGGTATCYAGIIKKQVVYNRETIHMMPSTHDELRACLRKIGRMGVAERRRLPGMEIERAEIFPTGLLILSTILGFFGFSKFKITADGLRMGALLHYFNHLPGRGDGSD